MKHRAAELLEAEPRRRPRESSGPLSCASGGRCQLAPRAAAVGKMAAVKGLEACLRVAGAAAARPERFLRYCGAAGFPGAGEPPGAGPCVCA